jgi:hypothetical protein
MPDDKTMLAPKEANLISLTEDYEVEYWTERFGITRERLAAAVRQVGRSAQAVERYFKGMWRSGGRRRQDLERGAIPLR